MIISIWRYSHLALALIASLFLVIASLTGIVLAVDEAHSSLKPLPTVLDAGNPPLAKTIAILKEKYLEVLSLSVDENDRLLVSAITEEGDLEDFYADPLSGKKLAEPEEQSAFVKFNLSLHRSLFLKTTGRVMVGISSFLLFLIAVTGLILLLKRQQGLKRLFKRIIKENFYQFTHTFLGRLFFIPLIVIALSGVYLSLLRFSLIPTPVVEHPAFEPVISGQELMEVSKVPLFGQTRLSEVRELQFPFSDAPEDYYLLSLHTKEMRVSQHTGLPISTVEYPLLNLISEYSLLLHTGRGQWIWASILLLSSGSLLLFMYSGFWMTVKRRSSRIRNSFRKEECPYIILIGSETGTTIGFARIFHQQLQKAGVKSFMAELNDFGHYPMMEQLILFTATYGQGEAPTNAKKFSELIRDTRIEKPFGYSVIGFGSLAYPDFCQYAIDVDHLLENAENGQRLLEPYTVNNRSWEAFKQWVDQWSKSTGLNISMPKKNVLAPKRRRKYFFEVRDKTAYGDTFLLKIKAPKSQIYQSGDLLAVYPEDGSHERLYSIGLADDTNHLLISVKLHEKGVCSNYLNLLEAGDLIDAQVIKNKHFHFPKRAKRVIMISTGTGIAPFLGMLNQNKAKIDTHLYWGSKTKRSLSLYQRWIEMNLDRTQLSIFHTAYSREDSQKTYVQDLIQRDALLVAQTLQNKGVIMICGSIAMQKGVTEVLQHICIKINNKPLSYYQNKGQLKMDCY